MYHTVCNGMCVYHRGVRVEKGGREDGGWERPQTSCISCWSLLFCTSSVLRESCSFSFLSISYETETQLWSMVAVADVKQIHKFSIALSMVVVAKCTSLIFRPRGKRKRFVLSTWPRYETGSYVRTKHKYNQTKLAVLPF